MGGNGGYVEIQFDSTIYYSYYSSSFSRGFYLSPTIRYKFSNTTTAIRTRYILEDPLCVHHEGWTCGSKKCLPSVEATQPPKNQNGFTTASKRLHGPCVV